jgi:hypothetical protein
MKENLLCLAMLIVLSLSSWFRPRFLCLILSLVSLVFYVALQIFMLPLAFYYDAETFRTLIVLHGVHFQTMADYCYLYSF